MSSLSLMLASCCVCFVCSFNIQPEFPSSVTNLPAHCRSGEQIILVVDIFQDHNKEQCGYHVFWLYPHFIVKQNENVILNLSPFWVSAYLMHKRGKRPDKCLPKDARWAVALLQLSNLFILGDHQWHFPGRWDASVWLSSSCGMSWLPHCSPFPK